MFNKKLQVEKVELVKKIIRQNSYGDYEKSHKQCIELGIRVNRPALDNFGKKLKKLDLAAKPSLEFDDNADDAPVQNGQILEFISPNNNKTNSRALDLDAMTQEQARQRETEITYELGELKIRENALLNELAAISEKFDENE